jgi:type I restriction enzyme S subunit
MISELSKVPSQWKKVKFEDIIENITDRIDNPQEAGLSNYIGLEHLDTDGIRIKRYGSPNDVQATKFLCKKGDIIFGKRRAYLRKLAVTERDAVVSAHSMVLRPKAGKIYSDFLPWFLHSSQFWKTAFAISEGSLSPTIKWKTLAAQEFWIPSQIEQKRIAEILWSIEYNIEKLEQIIQVSEKLYDGLLEELLTKGIGNKAFKRTEVGLIPEHWRVTSLGALCEERKEKKYPPYDKGEKYVSLEHMNSDKFIQSISAESQSVQSITNRFQAGDLLYGKLRPNLNKAALTNFNGICTTEILVLNSNSVTSNNYLLLHFKSKPFIEFNSTHAYGTKMPRTSFKILSKYKIALGPIEEQTKIVLAINSVNLFRDNCRVQIRNLESLKKKLNNLLLSGEITVGES